MSQSANASTFMARAALSSGSNSTPAFTGTAMRRMACSRDGKARGGEIAAIACVNPLERVTANKVVGHDVLCTTLLLTLVNGKARVACNERATGGDRVDP